MHQRKSYRRLRTAALLAFLGLASCVYPEPFDYTPIDEIPPGAGLFSGEQGAFVIGMGGKLDQEGTGSGEEDQN